jgi:hypothetical protein
MQMDEMTQQNAALVEEATAASQSMADQARDLNKMMSRYRIDQSAAAEWVAPKAQRANVEAVQAPRVERRSASRPWSKAPAKVAAVQESTGDTGTHKKVVGSANNDMDWQEF